MGVGGPSTTRPARAGNGKSRITGDGRRGRRSGYPVQWERGVLAGPASEPALAALVSHIATINTWNRLNVTTGQVSGEWTAQWVS